MFIVMRSPIGVEFGLHRQSEAATALWDRGLEACGANCCPRRPLLVDHGVAFEPRSVSKRCRASLATALQNELLEKKTADRYLDDEFPH